MWKFFLNYIHQFSVSSLFDVWLSLILFYESVYLSLLSFSVSVCFSVSLSVCFSVSLFMFLFALVCLSLERVSISLCLSLCMFSLYSLSLSVCFSIYLFVSFHLNCCVSHVSVCVFLCGTKYGGRGRAKALLLLLRGGISRINHWRKKREKVLFVKKLLTSNQRKVLPEKILFFFLVSCWS
jgi:hypothetical protein